MLMYFSTEGRKEDRWMALENMATRSSVEIREAFFTALMRSKPLILYNLERY
jgi:hypothetical protein